MPELLERHPERRRNSDRNNSISYHLVRNQSKQNKSREKITRYLKTMETTGGVLAAPGQKLNRLQIPNIQTLISRTEEPGVAPSSIQIGSLIGSQAKNLVSRPLTIEEQTIGITLDVNVTGRQLAPAGESGPVGSQSVGRKIPSTYFEARDAASLIIPGRAGKRSNVFKLEELKIIAQRLGIPATGGKTVVATNILNRLFEFFPGLREELKRQGHPAA